MLARLASTLFRAHALRQRVVFYIASIRREDLAYLKDLIDARAKVVIRVR